MNHAAEWNEEEDNFNLTLSQRTEELYRVPNLEPNEDGLIEAAVLPLRDLVIFPRMVSPIFVGREASLLAVQEAQPKNQTVIGLMQKDPEVKIPSRRTSCRSASRWRWGGCCPCRTVHPARWCRDAGASKSSNLFEPVPT